MQHVFRTLARLLTAARGDRGFTTVLFAASLPMLLGMSALVVDSAHLFVERRELQNAADAGSLAAARFLPTTNANTLGQARAAAIAIAAQNDVTITDADVTFTTVSQAYDVATVHTSGSVNFAFARNLGIPIGATSSNAAAQLGSLVAASGIMPWGLQDQTFSFGTEYCIKMGSNGGATCNSQSGHGDFGPIDIDNNGNGSGQIYDGIIATGSHTLVQVGQIKGVVNGNKQGPTSSGLISRIGSNTQTFDQVCQWDGTSYTITDWSSPRLVIIPVITGAGNNLDQVVGFVVFFIEQVGQGSSQLANGSVIGRFVDTVIPNGVWGTYHPGFGSRVIRLVQ